MAKGKKITGTSNNDTLQGTLNDDTISGLGGNDVLIGDAGNDILDGGAGQDLLFGGDGSDTYRFGKGYGVDTIRGTLGDRDNDPILFEAGDVLKFAQGIRPSDISFDIVAVEVEIEDGTETMWNLVLSIKGTQDKITIENYLTPHVRERGSLVFADGTILKPLDVYPKVRSDPDAAVFFEQYPSIVPGTDGNDYIIGTNQNDFIEAFGGDDSIRGEGGDDTILAGEGNNTVHGGGSDDWIEAGSGNDLLTGGGGNDVIEGGDGNNTIRGGDDDDALSGTGRLEGEAGDDYLYTGGASTLLGGAGNDYLYGSYDGGAGLLEGGDGNDILGFFGHSEATLRGGAGNDQLNVQFGSVALLEGGAGDDTLTAAEWNDLPGAVTVLDGGIGNDYYEGRDGYQHYRFGIGSGADTIGMYPGFLPGVDAGPIEFGAGDAVLLGAGVTPTGLTLDIVQGTKPDIFDPNLLYTIWNLKIGVSGSTDSLTIEGYLTDDPGTRGTLNFADGTVWDYEEVLSRVDGDAEVQNYLRQADVLIGAMAGSGAAPATGSSLLPPARQSPDLMLAAA